MDKIKLEMSHLLNYCVNSMTPLQKKRIAFAPPIPGILEDLREVTFSKGEKTSAIGDEKEIEARFPNTFARPILHLVRGGSERYSSKKVRVGVVLSGGQAAGGHNVITGLFDCLRRLHPNSLLVGFLGGPSGIINEKYKELTEHYLAPYRNQGGFDMLGSDRTKLEAPQHLQRALDVIQKLRLDGLVIIGGDDSNTNAAILAEYCIQRGCSVKVVGVPKTIDGDLKRAPLLACPFGFHSACQTYSEMIGNISRDMLSARKYTHFVKLMGRSASHVALECALQTQPNLALIGEEILEKRQTLREVTSQIADLVEKRGNAGKNYSIILIPEGVIEFIPEIKGLIEELNILLARKRDEKSLSTTSKEIFDLLPQKIQTQLLLDRDPHGNVQVSHVQTEELISAIVKEELDSRPSFKGKFNAIHHFFGYEGRSGFPTNFDATYCYALGHGAALLIDGGYSGYMSCVQYLKKNPGEWAICALPITSLMHLEMRKGKVKSVICKALVNLKEYPFTYFKEERTKWAYGDHYLYPGPIQFEGDPSCSECVPKSL